MIRAGHGLAYGQEDGFQRANELLAEGKKLFEEQEYKRAVRRLSSLVDERAATPTQRVQALEFIGLSHLILGQEKRGEEAFRKLLEIDAHHELSQDFDASKIREVFNRVREEFFLATLVHQAPAGGKAGEKLEMSAEVNKGQDLVKGVMLLVRKRGEPVFHPAPFRLSGKNRWSLHWDAPLATDPYVLEYYLEAQDVGGRLVGLTGTPGGPLTVPVQPGEVEVKRSDWYRRWYVIAIGGVVVGASTVLVISAVR